MSNSRREAMGRMFTGLAGGTAALAGFARQQAPTPSSPITQYPDGIGLKSMAHPLAASPMEQARQKAAQPLHQAIDRLYGNSSVEECTVSQFARQYGQNHHFDVHSCKSTSLWFKTHVIHEREKQKHRAITLLQDQISALFNSPLEGLENTMRDAVLGFLAEIEK